MSRNLEALTSPEPSGLHRPVMELLYLYLYLQYFMLIGASDSAVLGVVLKLLACWDCGLEFRRGHGCLSVVSVVCCQVEVSASGWSLVQRSPIEFGVSECDNESSIMRWP
jgi:hypothetical protein